MCFLTTLFINHGSLVVHEMRIISTNNHGERIVDPYNTKGKHDNWLKFIGYPNSTNYLAFEGISGDASELITKYVLDLFIGKNLARGTKRGQRSYIHLCNVRNRLRKLTEMLETQTGKLKERIKELEEELTVFRANMEKIKITVMEEILLELRDKS